jgi:phospholipid/cholesterol/gamma-HCH transport system permease protein
MTSAPLLTCTTSAERLDIVAAGAWTAAHSQVLEQLIGAAISRISGTRLVTIDMAGIRELDTLGGWLIERLVRRANSAAGQAQLIDLAPRYRGLMDEMHRVHSPTRALPPIPNRMLILLDRVGRAAAQLQSDFVEFVTMLGAVSIALGRVVWQPRRFRFTSTVYHLFRVGWLAVPIMALITFLIGGIIAQQGIFHFRKFGAEAYVVDMVGILVLREIGVLIVSIMLAGRSGSAYTAELGSMKMREEIDALRTMGFDPVEVLIVPRIIALVCALPILAFIGSMSALYGGGLVAWLYGGMSPAVFIARLKEAISLTHFEVGMIKAPFMALVIGIVACSEGLKVKGSSESLGIQTTSSVVKSIFLVIVLDGAFAIFFASIGM